MLMGERSGEGAGVAGSLKVTEIERITVDVPFVERVRKWNA